MSYHGRVDSIRSCTRAAGDCHSQFPLVSEARLVSPTQPDNNGEGLLKEGEDAVGKCTRSCSSLLVCETAGRNKEVEVSVVAGLLMSVVFSSVWWTPTVNKKINVC